MVGRLRWPACLGSMHFDTSLRVSHAQDDDGLTEAKNKPPVALLNTQLSACSHRPWWWASVISSYVPCSGRSLPFPLPFACVFKRSECDAPYGFSPAFLPFVLVASL